MARPSKAVLAARAKSKSLLTRDWPSSVPGVFFIAVGEPRWAARIRWQKDNAVHRDKTHVWKLSINPKTSGYTEKDLVHWQKQAEAWAEAEWLALTKSGKEFSRSALASSWTLEALLTKYLEGLDDGSIKYGSCASDRSRVRVLLGIAEKGANAHNKAFGPVLGKTMDELAPTDFYTEHPRSHPRAILLHYKGKNGHPTRTKSILNQIDASARRRQGNTHGVLARIDLKISEEISNIDLDANVVESIAHTLGDFPHERRSRGHKTRIVVRHINHDDLAAQRTWN